MTAIDECEKCLLPIERDMAGEWFSHNWQTPYGCSRGGSHIPRPNERPWMVSVNNGQRAYVVSALTAGDACTAAGDRWRDDDTVTTKQRTKGIYAINARFAKFGEVMSYG